VIRDLALDFVDRDLAVRGAQDVGQAILRQIKRDLAPDQAGEGEKPGQRAFQHANIGGDPVGKKLQHPRRQFQPAVLLAVNLGLLLQHAKAQLIVGRVQVNDQTALQAALDAVLEILDLARRAVGGNHDLLVLVDQRIEGMKELFLRRFLAGDELDIIDHQHVDRAKEPLEIHDLLFAQGLDEAVHELLGGKVKHPQVRLAGLQFMRDRMHQMGLAQPDAAIKEQGIEGDRAALGHPARGGMGQLIGLADDEAGKGEARIERRAGQVGLVGLRTRGTARARRRHIANRNRTGGGNLKFHPLDGQAGAHQVMMDLLGEIAHHPVAHEIRRHLEPGDTAFQLGQFQRFDP